MGLRHGRGTVAFVELYENFKAEFEEYRKKRTDSSNPCPLTDEQAQALAVSFYETRFYTGAHEALLGRYFRNLYLLVKFIKLAVPLEADIPSWVTFLLRISFQKC